MFIINVNISNKFNFWSVHGIMNTSGVLQSQREPLCASLTLQETRSIHDCMTIPIIEFISYINFKEIVGKPNFSDQFKRLIKEWVTTWG